MIREAPLPSMFEPGYYFGTIMLRQQLTGYRRYVVQSDHGWFFNIYLADHADWFEFPAGMPVQIKVKLVTVKNWITIVGVFVPWWYDGD